MIAVPRAAALLVAFASSNFKAMPLSSLSGPGRRTASRDLSSFRSSLVFRVLGHSFSRCLEAEAEPLVADGITTSGLHLPLQALDARFQSKTGHRPLLK